METEGLTHRRYSIRGRVQGVGFRHFVWREANARGIRGWVRNRVDGSVEVSACAARDELAAFELTLARGPRWGRVDAIEHCDVDPVDAPGSTFEIRATR